MKRNGHDDVLRQVRRKLMFQTILISCAILLLSFVIITRTAEGTNAYGMHSVAVVGDVEVKGNLVWNGSVGAYPRGSILMFKAACPSGWTAYTPLNNKIPQFSSTPNGTTDQSSHTHTYSHTHPSTGLSLTSETEDHQHSFSWATSSVGDHAHGGGNTWSYGGCSGIYGFVQFWDTTSSNGGHSHSVSGTTGFGGGSAHSHTLSGSSGSTTPAITANNTLPVHIRTVFCKKT